MGYLKSIKKYNPEYFVQPSQVKHFHTTLALWTAVSTTKLLLLSTVSQFVFGRAITSKLHQYNFKLHINSRDETVSVAMVMLDWEKKKKKKSLCNYLSWTVSENAKMNTWKNGRYKQWHLRLKFAHNGIKMGSRGNTSCKFRLYPTYTYTHRSNGFVAKFWRQRLFVKQRILNYLEINDIHMTLVEPYRGKEITSKLIWVWFQPSII